MEDVYEFLLDLGHYINYDKFNGVVICSDRESVNQIIEQTLLCYSDVEISHNHYLNFLSGARLYLHCTTSFQDIWSCFGGRHVDRMWCFVDDLDEQSDEYLRSRLISHIGIDPEMIYL